MIRAGKDESAFDSKLRPGEMQLLQALAIAASESGPVAESLVELMGLIGRHYQWALGRIVNRGEIDIGGQSSFLWANTAAEGPHSELPEWRNDYDSSLSSGGEPIIIADLLNEKDGKFYSDQANPALRGYVVGSIRAENQDAAILEFFAPRPITEEPNLRGIIAHAAALIGLVIERERSHFRLRESERRFRGIFDHSYQFIGLLSPDGTLIEVNQTALEVGGLSENEVVGRRI